jgi:hypothetical protein
MKSITFICCLVANFLVATFFAAVFLVPLARAPAHAEDITEMISQYRREHGLPAVKADPTLTAIAERQAKAMASSGIMDHSVAGSFASRISGASLATGAENIAAGTKTWGDTLRIWKESPGHNGNLLLSGADIIGVAVARNDDTRYKVYWAMVIGRRDTKRKPVTVIASAGGTEAGKGKTAAKGKDGGKPKDSTAAAPTAESSSGGVSEWVNGAITSIKSLLP